MKTKIRNVISSLSLILLVLTCFVILPKAQGGEIAKREGAVASPAEAVAGFNTRDGLNALISLTTGQFNSAFGFGALQKANSGSHNTAVGAQTLLSNTTGSF